MKLALLFPGYGSQCVGMGKELYDEYRIVQEYFEEAAHILNTNFVKLCFASSDAELSKLSNAYTSLFLVGACVYAVLKEQNIHPDVVAGYNNGESAALFAASSLSLPDGLYLLHKFCSFYQEYIDQHQVEALMVEGMSAVQLEKISKQAKEHAFIALYNNQMNHVVAGTSDKLSEIQDMIDGQATLEYIGAEVGLHSPLMNPVIDQFKDFLEKVDFKDLKIPLLSSIDATMITTGEQARERFIKHINEPLEWVKVTKALKDYDCIVIATPTKKLYEMIRQQYPEKIIVLIEKKEDIEKLKEMIKVE